MSDPLLTTQEAAEWLGASRRTLESWRLHRNGGPAWRNLGRRLVRYARRDLEAFAQAGAGELVGEEAAG